MSEHEHLYLRARELAQSGDADAAERLYRDYLALVDDDFRAYHNLSLLLAGSDDAEALQHAQAAHALSPEHPLVQFNLAYVLHKTGDSAAAREHWEGVLATQPDDPDVQFNYACTLYAVGERTQAIDRLDALLAKHPEYYEAHSNLALWLWNEGSPLESVRFAMQAIELQPNGIDYMQLARACDALGDFEHAVAHYLKAYDLDASQPTPLLLAAQRLAAEGNLERAVAELERHTEPDPQVQTMLTLYRRGGLDELPPDYVETLFDRFAASFDDQLQRLEYRTPSQLAAQFETFVAARNLAVNIVVDAGCGTGLLGVELAPTGRRLVGVDLSEKMLDQARRRGIYDRLVHSELTDYLDDIICDAIVAADVFNYFGDLRPVFDVSAGAIGEGGVLAFTIERGDPGQAVASELTGRFRHDPVHVEALLGETGFSDIERHDLVLRNEGSDTVHGVAFIARRKL